MKSTKCPQCGLVNFTDAVVCKRCNVQLQGYAQNTNQTYAYSQASSPTSAYNYSNSYQNRMYPNSHQNQNQTYSSPYQSPMASSSNSGGGAKMAVGALMAIGGVIASIASYSSAKEGGTYYVFWGLILVGAINFLRGLGAHFSDN